MSLNRFLHESEAWQVGWTVVKTNDYYESSCCRTVCIDDDMVIEKQQDVNSKVKKHQTEDIYPLC